MLNLIQKLRNRTAAHKSEHGYTLTELMVVLGLISIVSIMTLYAIVITSRTTTTFIQHDAGINQGQTADAVREAYSVATKFHDDYPDLEVTNSNLAAYGYIPDISPTIHWGVGQANKFSDNQQNEVCAVAWSTVEDEGKYSESSPVEINANLQGQGLFSLGCWGTVHTGTEIDPVTGETNDVYEKKHVANGLNEVGQKLQNLMYSQN